VIKAKIAYIAKEMDKAITKVLLNINNKIIPEPKISKFCSSESKEIYFPLPLWQPHLHFCPSLMSSKFLYVF
jgi:hypothetical protein